MNYSTVNVTGTDALGIVSNVATKITEIIDDFLSPFPNSFTKIKGVLAENTQFTGGDITCWICAKTNPSSKASFCLGAKKLKTSEHYYLVTGGEQNTLNNKHILLSQYFENNTVAMRILKNNANLVISFVKAGKGTSCICLTVIGECIKIKCIQNNGGSSSNPINYSLDSAQGRLATILPSANGTLAPDQILVGQYFYNGQNISNVYKYRASSTVAKYMPFEIEGLGTYYVNDDDYLIKV